MRTRLLDSEAVPFETLRAISPSPAQVDAAVVESSREIPVAGIVELVSFVAVLQMLHRLSSHYRAGGTAIVSFPSS